MAAYTWPTFTASEVLSGEGAREHALDLIAQQDGLKPIRRFGWSFPTQTETAASATLQIDEFFILPGYAETGVDHVELSALLWVTGGGTANVRFDLHDGTNTAASTTATTTQALQSTPLPMIVGPMICAIPALMADNQSGRIRLYLWKTGGGSALASCDNLMHNMAIDKP